MAVQASSAPANNPFHENVAEWRLAIWAALQRIERVKRWASTTGVPRALLGVK